MANNVNVAKVQTSDRTINQLQQNIITGMNDMNSVLVNLAEQVQTALDASTIVGEEKAAYLTEAQFQAIAGTNWVLQDGRSCVGSAYATLTGQTTVPDMRGRTGVAAGTGSGLTARALFDTGGEETHTLITSEIPAHKHHMYFGDGGANTGQAVVAATGVPMLTATQNQNVDGFNAMADTGGGGAHNNMQPFVVKNFFIRIN